MGIVVGPEAKLSVHALLEHMKVSGFGSILSIATTLSGVAGGSLITLPGSLTPTADHQLNNFKCLVTNAVNLTRDDILILKMSAWIHGGINDGLVLPTNGVQKNLDYEATGMNGK